MCSAEPPLGTQGGTALKVHNRFWRVPDLSSPSVDVRFGAAVAPQDFGRDGRKADLQLPSGAVARSYIDEEPQAGLRERWA
jgi:hypothetical protein